MDRYAGQDIIAVLFTCVFHNDNLWFPYLKHFTMLSALINHANIHSVNIWLPEEAYKNTYIIIAFITFYVLPQELL